MFRIIKKFNRILNKGQKIKIIIIAFMMLLGAILETLGVSLILPLITTILDTNIIETNQYAKMVCEIFDLHSSRTFMILVIAGLILVYLFKNIFLYVEYYVQYRFVYNNRFSTQVKIMEHYLHRPYDFFLNVNSGEITRVLLNDVRAAFELLTTILNFFTEAVIAVALVITIIIVDPFMALLISGILGILMLVISKVVRPVLRRAGKRYQKNAASSNKWLLQAISGIKELKVSRKESFFLEMFSKYGKRSIDAEKKNSVFSNIPRLLIESISICSVLSVIAVMLFMGKEVESLLPQLSVFALAAVRLLPSANRMSSAMNAMAYQELALDKIIENLSEINTLRNKQNKYNNKNKQNKENITKNNSRNIEKKNNTKKKNISDFQIKSKIEFSNVTFFYSEDQEAVLENAQMTIPIGKSIGIIGTSGAGKTTVVDILLGLLKPIKGQVLADGISIEDNYQGWLSQISYIPQMIFMLDDTIRANVAFGIHKDEINEQAVWEAIEEAQLGDFIRGLKEGLDTTIGERGVRLSGGQRQRIGIARALYTNPKLLIFDEATSALDNETEAAIMESINRLQGKKTLIIIAHRLSTIEECDILYRVADGKIICEGKR